MRRPRKQTNRSRKESKVFFHTLCTCGADASKIARGYPIGLRRLFPGKQCLRLTLRSLTTRYAIWRNSISAKDLRGWGANTAERISFAVDPMPGLRSVLPGAIKADEVARPEP
jgi:hypothetical protein